MNHSNQDIELTFDDLVRACGNQSSWVMALIDENVLEIQGEPTRARYNGLQLTQARLAYRIHRDFDASASATALILQLLDELQDLRRQP